MLNSFFSIHKRTYFLFNPDKSAYVKAIYKENMFSAELSHTRETIPLSRVSQIIQRADVIKKLESYIQSDDEKWFWKYAKEDHKNTLIFAFYLRKIRRQAKMPNVETSDWTKSAEYMEKYAELLAATDIRKIGGTTGIVEALIRTTGKHFRNLRFGHIHLTLDLLDNRQVWGIHWDASMVKDLNARSIVTHWLNDDIPS
jgi:hypothetical protein